NMCPEKYTSVGSQCLLFNTFHPLSNKDAHQICHNDHAHLAVIINPRRVAEFIMDNFGGVNFWLGACKTEKGVWMWPNGEQVGLPWVPGQPNDYNSQDCLYWKGAHYKHLGTKPEKPGIGFADGNCDMQ
ncbi:unnamed protein product, partial [Meganyctiphanes norvegica]